MVTFNKQRRLLGQKKPFKLEDIWRIRTRLEIEGNLMELALLNLAIDSKLRSCDLLRMRVCDISSSGIIHPRILFTQSKTQLDVLFEITAKTQNALSQWLFVGPLSPQDFIFPSPRKTGVLMSYSYYAHIIKKWATTLGLDAAQYGTHSIRRTKATLIYARTKNIRAIQLLLGYMKLDNTIRYLGVEIEDALKISEDTDI